MSIAKIRDGGTKNFLVSMVDSIDETTREQMRSMTRGVSCHGRIFPLSSDGVDRFLTIKGIDKQVQEIIDDGNDVGVIFYYDTRYEEISTVPVSVLTKKEE